MSATFLSGFEMVEVTNAIDCCMIDVLRKGTGGFEYTQHEVDLQAKISEWNKEVEDLNDEYENKKRDMLGCSPAELRDLNVEKMNRLKKIEQSMMIASSKQLTISINDLITKQRDSWVQFYDAVLKLCSMFGSKEELVATVNTEEYFKYMIEQQKKKYYHFYSYKKLVELCKNKPEHVLEYHILYHKTTANKLHKEWPTTADEEAAKKQLQQGSSTSSTSQPVLLCEHNSPPTSSDEEEAGDGDSDGDGAGDDAGDDAGKNTTVTAIYIIIYSVCYNGIVLQLLKSPRRL